MRARKVIKRLAVAAAVGVLVIAGGLYVQSIRIPGNYRPARLSADQKKKTVKEFWSKVQDFGNAAQRNDPYEWSVKRVQLNRFLAAMDDIAASTPSGESGRVHRAMAEAGLAEPAIDLDDGSMTFMVRSTQHNRIISAELAFSINGEGRLVGTLSAMRLGRLPLPRWLVQERFQEAKGLLSLYNDLNDGSEGRSMAGLSAGDLARLLGGILGGIDGDPIKTELTWPLKKKRVRIDRIEIDEKRLKLQVVPIGRG